MPQGRATPEERAAPEEQAVQFEVIPLRGIADEVVAQLPRGTRVTVTASPAQGLSATIEVACTLAAQGFPAIPHLAARMLRGPGEVEELVGRLTTAGVREIFVIAGDAPQPAGPYPGALPLLETLTAAGSGVQIGIGAHPEGHPFLGTAEALQLLRRKAQHASSLVTQMCFEAPPLLEWVRSVREAGISLPVRPGIAAPVGTARLLRIGTRIGVGRSLRLLTEADSGVRHLLGPGTWDPAPLFMQLDAAAAAEPELALAGPHVYTFNAVRAARDCVVAR